VPPPGRGEAGAPGCQPEPQATSRSAATTATDQGQSSASVRIADLVALARGDITALQRFLAQLSTPALECLADRIGSAQHAAHGQLRAAGSAYGITELAAPGLASTDHYLSVVAGYAALETGQRKRAAAEGAAADVYAALLAEAVTL